MLVCCWFDLGLRLLKVENGTFENRTIAGNSHYLVPFGNRTIAGTALIETALTGDPLYIALTAMCQLAELHIDAFLFNHVCQ